MNENELQNLLEDLLDTLSYENDDFPQLYNNVSSSFEEKGLLTNNSGIVLRLKDGSEFQISIVQSVYSDNSGEYKDD